MRFIIRKHACYFIPIIVYFFTKVYLCVYGHACICACARMCTCGRVYAWVCLHVALSLSLSLYSGYPITFLCICAPVFRSIYKYVYHNTQADAHKPNTSVHHTCVYILLACIQQHTCTDANSPCKTNRLWATLSSIGFPVVGSQHPYLMYICTTKTYTLTLINRTLPYTYMHQFRISNCTIHMYAHLHS